MPAASQFFPIVLPGQESFGPVALFSMEEGVNPYVDDQGQWKVHYIPLCLRLYPFIMARVADKEAGQDKFVLCLDRESDFLSTEEGEPLFTEQGELSELVLNTFETLKIYQQELSTTQNLFSQLAEKGVITDQKFEFQVNGQSKSIEGFKGIDMEILTSLDDESIASLVKNGTMLLVYCHLQSVSNLPLVASAS